jgi:hypothetical protein
MVVACLIQATFTSLAGAAGEIAGSAHLHASDFLHRD